MEVTAQLGLGRQLTDTLAATGPHVTSLDMSVTSSSNPKKLIVETSSSNFYLQQGFIADHCDVHPTLTRYYVNYTSKNI